MANLNYISPFFIVKNIEASVSFYVDKLGFEIRHIGPVDEPYWAIVGLDNISIMLKAIAPEIQPTPNHTRHEWARWDAYIYTTEPDTLFEKFRSNGVAFSKPIQDNSDDLRGFEIADADGYILFFGRPNLKQSTSN